MNEQMAVHILNELQTRYGRKFIPEAISKIWPLVLAEPDMAGERAFDYIILNFNVPNMPTAAKLLEIIQNEGKKIKTESGRIEDEKQRGYRRDQESNLFNSPAQTKLAQISMMIIKGILTPSPDYEKVLEAIKLASEAYPHLGWAKLGHDFQKEWREQGKIGNRVKVLQ